MAHHPGDAGILPLPDFGYRLHDHRHHQPHLPYPHNRHSVFRDFRYRNIYHFPDYPDSGNSWYCAYRQRTARKSAFGERFFHESLRIGAECNLHAGIRRADAGSVTKSVIAYEKQPEPEILFTDFRLFLYSPLYLTRRGKESFPPIITKDKDGNPLSR